jgi:hypothetical protein
MINPQSQDESRISTSFNKVKAISKYVQLNLQAYQYLRDKNYKNAMSTFEECINIAKDLDDIKHIESLTNHAICQFFCGNFEESYDFLEKAKVISSRLIENSSLDKQIQFLHLRVLANLSLTSLSLNKISDCKNQFNNCITLIKNNKNSNFFKLQMLKELVFIFFRVDSLSKFYEINQNIFENNLGEDIWNNSSNENINNNNQNKVANKCLFGLHKTLRENNIKYWFNCLNEEVSRCKKNKESSGFIFLLINQMAASFCYKGKINDSIKTTLSNIVKYYQEQYNKDLKIKEKKINNILNDFKLRMDTAVEIYKRIWDLENELNANNNININNNENNEGTNKFLIKILFRHALRYLSKPENQNDEIKNQIEMSMKLLENDEIDCSMISILNVNNEITKSLKLLFENLLIIRTKTILKEHLNKFKLNTLNYIKMSDKMKQKYVISEAFLKTKLEKLAQGFELTKFHYTSKGHTKHFYKIAPINGTYNLFIYKTLSEKKAVKVLPLSQIMKLTIGCVSDNLKKRLNPNNVIQNYHPWLFLSIYFPKRTIDLYFENDEQINDWFEGIYYYMWKISFNKNLPNFNLFFLTKLKLKLLYKLKDMNVNLSILDQIKAFEKENEIEFQSLPISKSILLYVKICEKLGRNIDY